MKIMLLACLPAFLRACVKFVSLCACRKVKKKTLKTLKKDPETVRGLQPVACAENLKAGGWKKKARIFFIIWILEGTRAHCPLRRAGTSRLAF